MAVATQVFVPAPDYPALFRDYILRAVTGILARIRNTGGKLSPDERDRAWHSLSYALGLEAAWPAARDLLLALAPGMERAGFREEWAAFLEGGIRCARLMHDDRAEGELRLQMGILCQLQAGYDEARRQLEASGAIFERLGDPRSQARALNRLAYVARRQRRFGEADQTVARAMGLIDEIDTERAYSYLVLGSLALDRESWHEAVDCFRQALDALGPDPDRRQQAWNLANLGLALWHADRLHEAADCYRQAIAMYEGVVEDPVHLAVARMNLGILFLKDRPEEALSLSVEAERTFRKVHDPLRLAKVCNNIGLACTHLRRWDEAEVAFQASVRFWRQVMDPVGVIDTLDGLGLLYAAQGRYAEAQVVYDEALWELSRIPNEPGHAHLCREVSAHRREATERLASRA